jgi:hypothetical protein
MHTCMLYTAWFLMFKNWFYWKYQYKKYMFNFIDHLQFILMSVCIERGLSALLWPGPKMLIRRPWPYVIYHVHFMNKKNKLIWSSLNFSLKHFELKKKNSNEFSFNGYVAIYSCTKIPVQCTKNLVQACTLNINLLINQNSVLKIFDHQKIRAPKIWVPGRFAPNPVRPLSRFAPIPVRPGSVHIS